MSADKPGPIIFVDDEAHVRHAIGQTLDLADFEVLCFGDAAEALQHVSDDFAGILMCDIKMPGMDGMTLMQAALAVDAELPVILITGHGDIATAVSAMHEGAYDFLEKPCPPKRLTDIARRALDKRSLTLENRRLRRQLEERNTPGPRLIGSAPAMKQLRALIARVADTDADVLVSGETGTGKELVARALHEQSRRSSGNFVAVNCGAIPDHLIESELFGHEAGAFTDARARRIGKIEHASGGTLFLDEIESMPTAMQIRLLRVLQERSLERLGSNNPVALDLRVVAATKVDLRQAADDKTARKLLMLIEGTYGIGVQASIAKYGYSEQRYYQLKKAFAKEGSAALVAKKTGPKKASVRTEAVQKQIIRMRFLDPQASAAVIAQKLTQQGMAISGRSVERTITAYGLQKKTFIN